VGFRLSTSQLVSLLRQVHAGATTGKMGGPVPRDSGWTFECQGRGAKGWDPAGGHGQPEGEQARHQGRGLWLCSVGNFPGARRLDFDVRMTLPASSVPAISVRLRGSVGRAARRRVPLGGPDWLGGFAEGSLV
jgi:hypothetical protein